MPRPQGHALAGLRLKDRTTTMFTNNPNQTSRWPALRLALATAAVGLALATAPAMAAIEDGYDPNGSPVPTTW